MSQQMERIHARAIRRWANTRQHDAHDEAVDFVDLKAHTHARTHGTHVHTHMYTHQHMQYSEWYTDLHVATNPLHICGTMKNTGNEFHSLAQSAATKRGNGSIKY